MLLLYRFRFLDDNRLVSWQDVFSVAGPVRFFGLLAPALAAGVLCSRFSAWERAPRLTLFLLAFSASALFWPAPEAILDAARYFVQAKHLAVHGAGSFVREWGRSLTAWTDLPLVPFIYGFLFSVFGESRSVIQAFNSLVFGLSAVLTFQLGRELWDETAGFFGGLFLLSVPYLYVLTPLMMVDVSAMFFLLLAVYGTLAGVRRGSWRVGLAVFGIAAACLTKYSLWLMLTSLGAAGAVGVLRSLDRRAAFFRLLGVLVVSGLLAGLFFWLKQDVVAAQFDLLASYQRPGLRRWGESFLSTFLFQVHPAVSLFALISVPVALLRRDSGYPVVLWTVLLVLLLRIERIRYALVVFPMVSLMASYGLLSLRQGRWARSIPWTSAAAAIVLAATAYLPFLEGLGVANLMRAGRYLDRMDAAGAEVRLSYADDAVADPAVLVPLLDLYTQKGISYQGRRQARELSSGQQESSLRFTWELRLPEEYGKRTGSRDSEPVILITDAGAGSLPPERFCGDSGRTTGSVFAARDDVYQFQSEVVICR